MLRDFVAPLFVPADRPERFDTAAASGADAIIVDLEDAVAASAKDAARAALRADFTDRPILVRINAFSTPWHVADLRALARHRFSALVLPKAEPGPELEALCAELPFPVVALIETAHGLAGARDLARTSGVTRLAFGAIDYCADVGCSHTFEALLSARCELVLASRLGGLAPPIDGITARIDDDAHIKNDARLAADLGFGGKLAIHPRQIAPLLEGFAPSATEIDWARRILASGDGAVAIDGVMVDEPVRIKAKSVLKRAQLPSSVP